MNYELYKQQTAEKNKQVADDLVSRGMLTQEQAASLMNGSTGVSTEEEFNSTQRARDRTLQQSQAATTTSLTPQEHAAAASTSAEGREAATLEEDAQVLGNTYIPSLTDTLEYFSVQPDVLGAHQNNYRNAITNITPDHEILWKTYSPDRKMKAIEKIAAGQTVPTSLKTGWLNQWKGMSEEITRDLGNRWGADPIHTTFVKTWNDKVEKWSVLAPAALVAEIAWGTVAGTVTGTVDIIKGDAVLEDLLHVGSMAASIATGGAAALGAVGKVATASARGATAAGRMGRVAARVSIAKRAYSARNALTSVASQAPGLGYGGLHIPNILKGGALGRVSGALNLVELGTNPQEILFELVGDIGIDKTLSMIHQVSASTLGTWANFDMQYTALNKGLDKRLSKIENKEVAAKFEESRQNIIADESTNVEQKVDRLDQLVWAINAYEDAGKDYSDDKDAFEQEFMDAFTGVYEDSQEYIDANTPPEEVGATPETAQAPQPSIVQGEVSDAPPQPAVAPDGTQQPQQPVDPLLNTGNTSVDGQHESERLDQIVASFGPEERPTVTLRSLGVREQDVSGLNINAIRQDTPEAQQAARIEIERVAEQAMKSLDTFLTANKALRDAEEAAAADPGNQGLQLAVGNARKDREDAYNAFKERVAPKISDSEAEEYISDEGLRKARYLKQAGGLLVIASQGRLRDANNGMTREEAEAKIEAGEKAIREDGDPQPSPAQAPQPAPVQNTPPAPQPVQAPTTGEQLELGLAAPQAQPAPAPVPQPVQASQEQTPAEQLELNLNPQPAPTQAPVQGSAEIPPNIDPETGEELPPDTVPPAEVAPAGTTVQPTVYPNQQPQSLLSDPDDDLASPEGEETFPDETGTHIYFNSNMSQPKHLHLSNFSLFGFTDENKVYWRSVEHYFQAQKFAPNTPLSPEGQKKYGNDRIKTIYGAIKDSSSAARSKKIASEHGDKIKQNWFDTWTDAEGQQRASLRDSTMYKALDMKYRQNTTSYDYGDGPKSIAERLVETGEKALIHIEQSADAEPYWGIKYVAGKAVGQNMQGRMLAQIRVELAKEELPEAPVGTSLRAITKHEMKEQRPQIDISSQNITPEIYMRGDKSILNANKVFVSVSSTALFDKISGGQGRFRDIVGGGNEAWTDDDYINQARSKLGIDPGVMGMAELKELLRDSHYAVVEASRIAGDVGAAIAGQGGTVVTGGNRGGEQGAGKGASNFQGDVIAISPNSIATGQNFYPNYPPAAEKNGIPTNMLVMSMAHPSEISSFGPLHGSRSYARNNLTAGLGDVMFVPLALSLGDIDAAEKALMMGRPVFVLSPGYFKVAVAGNEELLKREGVYEIPYESNMSAGRMYEYMKAVVALKQLGRVNKEQLPERVVEEVAGYTDEDFRKKIQELREAHEVQLQSGNHMDQLRAEYRLSMYVRAHALSRPRTEGDNPRGYHSPLTDYEKQVTTGIVGLHNYPDVDTLISTLRSFGKKVIFVETRANPYSKSELDGGVWTEEWYHGSVLGKALKDADIEYVDGRIYAPTNSIRRKQRGEDELASRKKHQRTRLAGAYVAAYNNHIAATPGTDLGAYLSDLIQTKLGTAGAGDAIVVFACVEKPAAACHRSLLADIMVEDLDLNVLDIQGTLALPYIPGEHSHSHGEVAEDAPLLETGHPLTGRTRVNVSPASQSFSPGLDSHMKMIDFQEDENGPAVSYGHTDYPGWVVTIKKAADGSISPWFQAPGALTGEETELLFARHGKEAREPFTQKFDDIQNMEDIAEYALRLAVASRGFLPTAYETIRAHPERPELPANQDHEGNYKSSRLRYRYVATKEHQFPIGLGMVNDRIGTTKTTTVVRGVRLDKEHTKQAGSGQYASLGDTEFKTIEYWLPQNTNIRAHISEGRRYVQIVAPKGTGLSLPLTFPQQMALQEGYGDFMARERRHRQTIEYNGEEIVLSPADLLWEYFVSDSRIWQSNGGREDGIARNVKDVPESIATHLFKGMTEEIKEREWALFKSFLRRGRSVRVREVDAVPAEVETAVRFAERLPPPPSIPEQISAYLTEAYRQYNIMNQNPEFKQVPVPEYKEILHSHDTQLSYNEVVDNAFQEGIPYADEDRQVVDDPATAPDNEVEDEPEKSLEELEEIELDDSDADVETPQDADVWTVLSRVQQTLKGTKNEFGTLWESGALFIPKSVDYKTKKLTPRTPEKVVATTATAMRKILGINIPIKEQEEALNEKIEVAERTGDNQFLRRVTAYKRIQRYLNRTADDYIKIDPSDKATFQELLDALHLAHQIIKTTNVDFTLYGFEVNAPWSTAIEGEVPEIEELPEPNAPLGLAQSNWVQEQQERITQTLYREGQGDWRRGWSRMVFTNTGVLVPRSADHLYVVDGNEVYRRPPWQVVGSIAKFVRYDTEGGVVEKRFSLRDKDKPVFTVINDNADELDAVSNGVQFTLDKREGVVSASRTENGPHRVNVEVRNWGEHPELAIAKAVDDGLWLNSPVPLNLTEMDIENESWGYTLEGDVPFVSDTDGNIVSNDWRFTAQIETQKNVGFVYRIKAFRGEDPANIFKDAAGERSEVLLKVTQGNWVRTASMAISQAIAKYQPAVSDKEWSFGQIQPLEVERSLAELRELQGNIPSYDIGDVSFKEEYYETAYPPEDVSAVSWEALRDVVFETLPGNMGEVVEETILDAMPVTRLQVQGILNTLYRSGVAGAHYIRGLRRIVPSIVEYSTRRLESYEPTPDSELTLELGGFRKVYRFNGIPKHRATVLEGSGVARIWYKAGVALPSHGEEPLTAEGWVIIDEFQVGNSPAVWQEIENAFLPIVQKHYGGVAKDFDRTMDMDNGDTLLTYTSGDAIKKRRSGVGGVVLDFGAPDSVSHMNMRVRIDGDSGLIYGEQSDFNGENWTAVPETERYAINARSNVHQIIQAEDVIRQMRQLNRIKRNAQNMTEDHIPNGLIYQLPRHPDTVDIYLGAPVPDLIQYILPDVPNVVAELHPIPRHVRIHERQGKRLLVFKNTETGHYFRYRENGIEDSPFTHERDTRQAFREKFGSRESLPTTYGNNTPLMDYWRDRRNPVDVWSDPYVYDPLGIRDGHQQTEIHEEGQLFRQYHELHRVVVSVDGGTDETVAADVEGKWRSLINYAGEATTTRTRGVLRVGSPDFDEDIRDIKEHRKWLIDQIGLGLLDVAEPELPEGIISYRLDEDTLRPIIRREFDARKYLHDNGISLNVDFLPTVDNPTVDTLFNILHSEITPEQRLAASEQFYADVTPEMRDEVGKTADEVLGNIARYEAEVEAFNKLNTVVHPDRPPQPKEGLEPNGVPLKVPGSMISIHPIRMRPEGTRVYHASSHFLTINVKMDYDTQTFDATVVNDLGFGEIAFSSIPIESTQLGVGDFSQTSDIVKTLYNMEDNVVMEVNGYDNAAAIAAYMYEQYATTSGQGTGIPDYPQIQSRPKSWLWVDDMGAAQLAPIRKFGQESIVEMQEMAKDMQKMRKYANSGNPEEFSHEPKQIAAAKNLQAIRRRIRTLEKAIYAEESEYFKWQEAIKDGVMNAMGWFEWPLMPDKDSNFLGTTRNVKMAIGDKIALASTDAERIHLRNLIEQVEVLEKIYRRATVLIPREISRTRQQKYAIENEYFYGRSERPLREGVEPRVPRSALPVAALSQIERTEEYAPTHPLPLMITGEELPIRNIDVPLSSVGIPFNAVERFAPIVQEVMDDDGEPLGSSVGAASYQMTNNGFVNINVSYRKFPGEGVTDTMRIEVSPRFPFNVRDAIFELSGKPVLHYGAKPGSTTPELDSNLSVDIELEVPAENEEEIRNRLQVVAYEFIMSNQAILERWMNPISGRPVELGSNTGDSSEYRVALSDDVKLDVRRVSQDGYVAQFSHKGVPLYGTIDPETRESDILDILDYAQDNADTSDPVSTENSELSNDETKYLQGGFQIFVKANNAAQAAHKAVLQKLNSFETIQVPEGTPDDPENFYNNYKTLNQALALQMTYNSDLTAAARLVTKESYETIDVEQEGEGLANLLQTLDTTSSNEVDDIIDDMLNSPLWDNEETEQLQRIRMRRPITNAESDPTNPKNISLLRAYWAEMREVTSYSNTMEKWLEIFEGTYDSGVFADRFGPHAFSTLAAESAWLRNSLATDMEYHTLMQGSAEMGAVGMPPHLMYAAIAVANAQGSSHVRFDGIANGWAIKLARRLNATFVERDKVSRGIASIMFPATSISEYAPRAAVSTVVSSQVGVLADMMKPVEPGGRLVLVGNSKWHTNLMHALSASKDPEKTLLGYKEELLADGNSEDEAEQRGELFGELRDLAYNVQGSLYFTSARTSRYASQTGGVIVIDNTPSHGESESFIFNLDEGAIEEKAEYTRYFEQIASTRRGASYEMYEYANRKTEEERKKKFSEEASKQEIRMAENDLQKRIVYASHPKIKQRVMAIGNNARRGSAIIRGTRIGSIEEMAVAAELGRSPNMANVQIVKLRNGVVESGILASFGVAGDVKPELSQIEGVMPVSDPGTETVVVMNRPSGDTRVTPEDRKLAAEMIKSVDGFAYILIKDGDTYSVIEDTKDGNMRITGDIPFSGSRQQTLPGIPVDMPSWVDMEDADALDAVPRSLATGEGMLDTHRLLGRLVESNDNWAVIVLVNPDSTVAEMVEIYDAFDLTQEQIGIEITKLKQQYGGMQAYAILRSEHNIEGEGDFWKTSWGEYLRGNPGEVGYYLRGGAENYPSEYAGAPTKQLQESPGLQVIETSTGAVANFPTFYKKLFNDVAPDANTWERAKSLYLSLNGESVTSTRPLTDTEHEMLRENLNMASATYMASMGPSFSPSMTILPTMKQKFEELLDMWDIWQNQTTIPLNGAGRAMHPAYAYLVHYLSSAKSGEVVLIPNAGGTTLISFDSGHAGQLLLEADANKRAALTNPNGLGFEPSQVPVIPPLDLNVARRPFDPSQVLTETEVEPDKVLLDVRDPLTFWESVVNALEKVKNGGRVVAYVNVNVGGQVIDEFRKMSPPILDSLRANHRMQGFINHEGHVILVVDKEPPKEGTPVSGEGFTDVGQYLDRIETMRTEVPFAESGDTDAYTTGEEELPPDARAEAKRQQEITTPSTPIVEYETIGEQIDANTLLQNPQALYDALQPMSDSERVAYLGYTPEGGFDAFFEKLSGLTAEDEHNPSTTPIAELDKSSIEVAIAHRMKVGRPVEITGETRVETAKDAAALFYPLRHLGYEKSLFIGVDKDGKVIHTVGLTVNSGYRVPSPTVHEITRILNVNPEIEGFWFVHHHPGTPAKWSGKDKAKDVALRTRFGDMYKGMALTDTGEYGFIENGETGERLRLEGVPETDRDPNAPEFIGTRVGAGTDIATPQDIANLAKDFVTKLSTAEDLYTLVFMGRNMQEELTVVDMAHITNLHEMYPGEITKTINDMNGERGALRTMLVVSRPTSRTPFENGGSIETALRDSNVVSSIFIETNESDFPMREKSLLQDVKLVQQGEPRSSGRVIPFRIEDGEVIDMAKQSQFIDHVVHEYLLAGIPVAWEGLHSFRDEMFGENVVSDELLNDMVDAAFSEWAFLVGLTHREGIRLDHDLKIKALNHAYRSLTGRPFSNKRDAGIDPPVENFLTIHALDLKEGEKLRYDNQNYVVGIPDGVEVEEVSVFETEGGQSMRTLRQDTNRPPTAIWIKKRTNETPTLTLRKLQRQLKDLVHGGRLVMSIDRQMQVILEAYLIPESRNQAWRDIGVTADEVDAVYAGVEEVFKNNVRAIMNTGNEAQIVIDKPLEGEGIDNKKIIVSDSSSKSMFNIADIFDEIRRTRRDLSSEHTKEVKAKNSNPRTDMEIESSILMLKRDVEIAQRTLNRDMGRSVGQQPDMVTRNTEFGTQTVFEDDDLGSPETEGKVMVMVHGLAGEVVENDLRKEFAKHGTPGYINIPFDRSGEPGQANRGDYGYIVMDSEASAQATIRAINQTYIGNRLISVTMSNTQFEDLDPNLPTGDPNSFLAWDSFLSSPFLPHSVRQKWMEFFNIKEVTTKDGTTYERTVSGDAARKVMNKWEDMWKHRLGAQLSRPIYQMMRWGAAGQIVSKLVRKNGWEAKSRAGKGFHLVTREYDKLYRDPEIKAILDAGQEEVIEHRGANGRLPGWLKKQKDIVIRVDDDGGVEMAYNRKTGEQLTIQNSEGKWVTRVHLTNDTLLDAWINTYFGTHKHNIMPGSEAAARKIKNAADKIRNAFDVTDGEIIKANREIMNTGILANLGKHGVDLLDAEMVLRIASEQGIAMPDKISVRKLPNIGNMMEWVITEEGNITELYRLRYFTPMESVVAKGRKRPEGLKPGTRDFERHYASLDLYSDYVGNLFLYRANPRDPIFSKKAGVEFQLFAGRPHDMPQLINWSSMDPYSSTDNLFSRKVERFEEYVTDFYELNRDIHKNEPGWTYNNRPWTRGHAREILQRHYEGFNDMHFEALEGDSELVYPAVAYESMAVLGEYSEQAAQRTAEILNYGQKADLLQSSLDELRNPANMDLEDLPKALLKLRRAMGHDDYKREAGEFSYPGDTLLVPYDLDGDRRRTTRPEFDKMTQADWDILVENGIITNVIDVGGGYYAWALPPTSENEGRARTQTWLNAQIKFDIAPDAGALVDPSLINLHNEINREVNIAIFRYFTAKEALMQYHKWHPKLVDMGETEKRIRMLNSHDIQEAQELESRRAWERSAFGDAVIREQERLRNPVYKAMAQMQNLSVFLFLRLSSWTQVGTWHNPAHVVGLPALAKATFQDFFDKEQRQRLEDLSVFQLEMTQMIGMEADNISQERVGLVQRMMGGNKYWRWHGHGGFVKGMRAFYHRGNQTPFAWFERRLRGSAALGGIHMTESVLKELLVPSRSNHLSPEKRNARKLQNITALTDLDPTVAELLEDVRAIRTPDGGWTEEIISDLVWMSEDQAQAKYSTRPEMARISRLADRMAQIMPDITHFEGTSLATPDILDKHVFLRFITLFQRIMVTQVYNMKEMAQYNWRKLILPRNEAKKANPEITALEQAGLIAPEVWRMMPKMFMSLAAIIGSGYAATILSSMARFKEPDDEDLTIQAAFLNSAVLGVFTSFIENKDEHKGWERLVTGATLGFWFDFLRDPFGTTEFYLLRPYPVDFRNLVGIWTPDQEVHTGGRMPITGQGPFGATDGTMKGVKAP